jgi:hypothetical protein
LLEFAGPPYLVSQNQQLPSWVPEWSCCSGIPASGHGREIDITHAVALSVAARAQAAIQELLTAALESQVRFQGEKTLIFTSATSSSKPPWDRVNNSTFIIRRLKPGKSPKWSACSLSVISVVFQAFSESPGSHPGPPKPSFRLRLGIPSSELPRTSMFLATPLN